MANNTVRSAVVLLVLFGTFALAIPYVSSVVDAWLFADRSATPAQATAAVEHAQSEVDPTAYVDNNERQTSRLAFEYREDAREVTARQPVMPTQFLEPLPAPTELPIDESRSTLHQLQQRLDQLGAAHLVVEQLGNKYECRTLIPIAAESSYQKAFSATASSPEEAMEQVIADVQVWQRSSRR